MTATSVTLDVVRVRTRRGLELAIRPIVADDRELLERGFAELSDDARYKRFFSPMPELKSELLERLVHPDQQDHIALGAVDPSAEYGSGGRPVGVVRAFRIEEHPERAEFAITVVDDYQNKGVGEILIASLAAAALSRGIVTLEADILASNRAMKSLIRTFGGSTKSVEGDRSVAHGQFESQTAAARLPGPKREELLKLLP